jgi:hypothetical protein
MLNFWYRLPSPQRLIGPGSRQLLNRVSVLCVADAAGVPGALELAGRPGGVVPTADRLRVPPALPQLPNNACRPGSQGLVRLPSGEYSQYTAPAMVKYCFFLGTDWTLKHCLDELRLQSVKSSFRWFVQCAVRCIDLNSRNVETVHTFILILTSGAASNRLFV